ncbi:hypothetical protein [Streptomyces yangpuensis]|uniref:hypothetical protein n=1 Tax=Streptomyces yangpuensis TaxID=1648182 RepID=UPI00382F64FE
MNKAKALPPLQIVALPPRREWKLERVWAPDADFDDTHVGEHEKASVTIGGRRLPRDLDTCEAFAYKYAGLPEEDHFGAPEDGTGLDDPPPAALRERPPPMRDHIRL